MNGEMNVSRTRKEQYDQDGYIVLEKLFTTEEVLRFKQEAARVLEENAANRAGGGVFLGMAAASPLFKEAAKHPKLVEILKEVFSDKVIFMSDKLVYKNATTSFRSPWHQDYAYWKGSNKLSVWIALDDAAPENGCLKFIPGSHLLGDIDHTGEAENASEIGFGHRLSESDIDASKVIDMPVSKGDAVIFHDQLFHTSYPNTSGKDRWALISTYKDGHLDDPEYPWAVAAFEVTE